MPVTPASASVQVQTSTESSFAVSGTKCFDINYFNVPGRTKADFSSSYIYKLSGVLGSNATISSVVWSYTNPKGAVAEFTPVATSTTPANNQVTVKYDPALLSDATIDATGIVVTITATITTVSSGCPNATYTINIPVKIRDAVCCPGVLIEGGVHTGPDMKAYSDGTPYSTLVSGTDNFTRIASQDLCVYYRDALNGSTKDFPWNDASSANGCANTTGGVYVDAAHASMGWRLPNIAELGYMQSLSTPTWDHFEDAPTYSGTANMLSYRYWSSTQHNNDRSMSWRYGSSYAYWYVNTSDGSARCVRIMD
jgi:hypothetical protein